MPFYMSQADNWLCPAYPLDVKREETLAAAEGTAAAEALEWCIRTGVTPSEYVGKTATNGVLVTSEMADCVDAFFRALDRLGATPSNGWSLYPEENLSAGYLHPDCRGRADLVGLRGREILVADFKYGRTPVYAENNAQLASEAIGVFEKLEVPVEEWGEYAVKFLIVQPRSLDRSARMSVQNISADGLRRMAELFIKAIRDRGSAPRYEPGARCRYCPRLGVCPATVELDWFAMARTESPILVSSLSGVEKSAEMEMLSQALGFLKKRAEALNLEIRRDIQDGRETGHVLEARHGPAKFVASEETVAYCLRKFGVDPYQAPKLKTPRQARDSAPAKTRPEIHAFLDSVTQREEVYDLVPATKSMVRKSITEDTRDAIR